MKKIKNYLLISQFTALARAVMYTNCWQLQFNAVCLMAYLAATGFEFG